MNKLFDEIENDILRGHEKIESILRKCLKLSYGLGDEGFKQWSKNELSGYPENQPQILPHYRHVKSMIRGDYILNGTLLTNQQVQSYTLPEHIREVYSGRIYLPVSEIEFMITSRGGDNPYRELPLDLLPYFSNYPMNYACIKAVEIIPLNNFVKIIDELKTNILLLCMELKAKFPEIGNGEKNLIMNENEKKSVEKIITMNVYGNANIASDSESFSQTIQVNSDELVNKLLSELVQLKMHGEDAKIIDDVIPHVEAIKQIKDHKSVVSKLAEIMTIAGGSASVCGLIAQYIPAFSNLIS